MTTLHPVILCGEYSDRYWPPTDAAYHQQVLTVAKTPLQAIQERAAALPGAQAPLLICHEEHRLRVHELCQATHPVTRCHLSGTSVPQHRASHCPGRTAFGNIRP